MDLYSTKKENDIFNEICSDQKYLLTNIDDLQKNCNINQYNSLVQKIENQIKILEPTCKVITPQLKFSLNQNVHVDRNQLFFLGFYVNYKNYGFGKLIYSRNQALNYEGIFYDGQPHGEDLIFYTNNGQIKTKCSKKVGVLIGICINYWPNGGFMSKIWYNEKGEKHGEEKKFWENGNLWQYNNWSNGLLEGEYLEYYENSNLMTKCFFKEGKQEGYVQEKYRNGIQESYIWYVNGKPHQNAAKKYFKNGALMLLADYKNGFITGNCTIYAKCGRIRYRGVVVRKGRTYPRSNEKGDVSIYRDDGTIYAGPTLGVPLVSRAYRIGDENNNNILDLDNEENFDV